MSDFLERPDGERLAYEAVEGRGPTLVWLGGFNSDMVGTKAQALADWARANGRACVVEYSLPNFAHGMPVDAATSPAPFFLPSNVSAARQIAGDWGLLATKRRGLLARLGLSA